MPKMLGASEDERQNTTIWHMDRAYFIFHDALIDVEMKEIHSQRLIMY